jgi:alcohol dehydrogenase (cytochrome c)
VTGVSGGEFGIRGRLTAYDGQTGKEVWRFYTIPGPGEPGHETWPRGDAWQHGGAPVWQTPSVDPKLGLLYFSTGNAGPDNNASDRAGTNLFAASMVALDAKTGKLRWYYHMVHHDIWDYDAPTPTILFDVKIDGTLRHGIGQAEKTGWPYLLDRTNGKPLLPVPEDDSEREEPADGDRSGDERRRRDAVLQGDAHRAADPRRRHLRDDEDHEVDATPSVRSSNERSSRKWRSRAGSSYAASSLIVYPCRAPS